MKSCALFINLFLLCVDVTYLKPLPKSNVFPLIWNHINPHSGSSRIRRSIPDFDAVNPDYLDESPSGDSAGSQKDISSFALGGQVSNFFKSNKLPSKNENSRKGPVRQVPGERAMRVAEGEDSLDDGGLRSDEQEECYKQQNIELPWPGDLEKKSQMNQKIQKLVGAKRPMTDVAYGPRTSYVRSDVLKKSGKYYRPQESDFIEIHSLYSEPEKQSNYQIKTVNNRKMKTPVGPNDLGRVYKPVEVQPMFPVYDEDIDFHPDPLQGILDDKYWLDPLEQEAVIRKYIDLASNNMMPPDVEIVKRRAPKENNARIGYSKTELKDAAERCPCKDIKDVVGCKECKGKGQQNFTNDESPVSYGRKLLSVDFDNSNISHGGSKEGNEIQENNQSSNVNVRQFLIWKDGDVNELEGDDNNVHMFHRRRILSYEDRGDLYDADDEGESDEDMNRSYPELNHRELTYDIQRNEDHKVDPELEEYAMSKYKESYRSANGEPQVVGDLTKVKDNNLPVKPPAYYTPNKFANILQKQLKEKPKGPKKNKEKIDPNREFEVIRNETIQNATLLQGGEKTSYNVPDRNVTTNTTNVEKTGQSLRQRLDEDRLAHERTQLKSIRYQQGEYFGDPGGYSYKGDYNVTFDKEGPAPSFLEEPQLVPNDVKGYISNKRSGEIKRSYQKGSQNVDNLKHRKYIPFGQKIENCGGYSYKDGLNVPQFLESPTNDNVKQVFPQGNRSLRKRWDDRRMYAHKGRRSFTDLSNIKHPSLPLFQNSDEVALSVANTTSEALNETIANTTSNGKAEDNTTSTTNTTNLPVALGLDNTTTVRPNITSRLPTTMKSKNKDVEKAEDAVDTEIAKVIVETVISESQKSSVLGHHLGLCRRNESMGNVNYGRVVPETEKVLKSVTDCIMNRLKSHLEKQSCVLLDIELLEFLKWMVLSGESYRDYLMKIRGYHQFLPKTTQKPATCEVHTEAVQTTCEAETPPPLLNGTI